MTDTIPAALPGSTSEPILLAFSGGLDTTIADGDSVTILPAVAGG